MCEPILVDPARKVHGASSTADRMARYRGSAWARKTASVSAQDLRAGVTMKKAIEAA
jgi:hypothetical protein